MQSYNFAVVGSGMGALTTACLLAKRGLRGIVLEQNYLPGGCTSSYWRKGFVFESGATTLVGLDKNMPLRYLIDELGIDIQPIKLDLPMKVYLKNGTIINRYQNIEEWIGEAERVFGKKNQRKFWEFCLSISEFVWQTSLRQTAFPPTNLSDWWQCARRVNIAQLRNAGYAFYSMRWLLQKYDLLDHQDFIDFVNEQLLITAQNTLSEVNVLFGATALCYTNFGNYYMPGGLINLVNPLLEYLQKQGTEVHLRESVQKIRYEKPMLFDQEPIYQIISDKAEYRADFLISGIPINNTLKLYEDKYAQQLKPKVLTSKHLNSAFQMGIGFKTDNPQSFDCIHHQIHLPEPLSGVGSKSIFISLNHPTDGSRCDLANTMVASVSTHIAHPEANLNPDKQLTEASIIRILIEKGFFKAEDIIYQHSSTQKSWQKWTAREYGFVGGYPQYFKIKPWQMLEARLDRKRAYQCGDTTYPGQGIPGTVLSGIIAFEKLRRDWKI
ncbi:MAG: NAD(P)/FAD-dependent oxidoreductase [Microscillaceae bacterium]|nr:NAD(P)/FAD-dependent oxidoreductase [Microscillaceae bacterium]